MFWTSFSVFFAKVARDFQCIIRQPILLAHAKLYSFEQNTHRDRDRHTQTTKPPIPTTNIVTTKTALTCVIEHYADLDQPAETLIFFHVYDGFDGIVYFFGHGKRQRVATMLALLQEQVLVPHDICVMHSMQAFC